LLSTVISTNGFYSPLPPPSWPKSGSKLVCNVNVVYRNPKSEIMPRNLNEIVRSWIRLQANTEYTLPLVVFLFSVQQTELASNLPKQAEGIEGGWGWSRFSKRYIWACNSRFLLYDKVERKLRRTKHNNALFLCSECLQYVQYGTQSTQREAMATFWRTFHHDSKISPASEDWGCTPHLPSRAKLWCALQLRGQIGRPLSKVLPCPNKGSRSCFLNFPQLRDIP
jgi:hypothetical protein